MEHFWWMVVALAAVTLYFMVSTRRDNVYSNRYTFSTGTLGEPSFVTPVFELKGQPSNVELRFTPTSITTGRISISR